MLGQLDAVALAGMADVNDDRKRPAAALIQRSVTMRRSAIVIDMLSPVVPQMNAPARSLLANRSACSSMTFRFSSPLRVNGVYGAAIRRTGERFIEFVRRKEKECRFRL